MSFYIKKIFIAISIQLVCLGLIQAEGEKTLTYEQFITEVEAGRVVSAQLNAFSGITGEYNDESGVRKYRSFSKTGAPNDPLLVKLLNDNKVELTLAKEPKKNWYYMLAYGAFNLLLPIVTLVFLFKINKKVNQLAERS